MRPLRAIHLLVALLATVAVAHAWESANSDLPAVETPFNGNGSRTSGVVQTYNIPLTNFPETIYFSVRGGDGGNADAGPNSNKDKFQGKGGGGAVATATFSISSTAANALRPGGEIRVIVGNRGAHMQGGSGGIKVAAGGGGGSSVIYKGPQENADWEPLIIAGGGGGGMTSSFSTGVIRSNGGNGQIGPIGSIPTGGVFATHGGAGQSIVNRGEGGAGWLHGAYYGAGQGESSGGVGGASRYSTRTSSGGFGCGGGGGAGGEKAGTVTAMIGGGGGGGYSGGGGGNTSQAGGGGGSIIDARAINDVTQTLTQRGGAQLNGYVSIQPSSTTVPDANANPVITLVGGNPHDVAFSSTDAYTDPGATAKDFYGNTISPFQMISNTVNRAVTGQYQVVYEATDQFGQTSQKTRTVNVLAGSLRPTFTLQPSLIVAPTGSQSHNIISGFNAGWLGGGNAEQLVRYEITGNSNPSLFATAPGLSNSGDLSFATKDNTLGTATLTIIAIDNGPDPSVVQSLPQQITITVSIAPEPAQFILVTDPLELGASVDFREDAASLIVGTVLSTAPVSSPDLTYSLSGVDADKFTLGESDGILTFKTRPDYNDPTDAGADHIYDITVTTEDGTSAVPANLTVHLLSAPAATFTVTNAADTGTGSLRHVIAQANNKIGQDIIDFDPSFFNQPRTITLSSGNLVINRSVSIRGPGQGLLTIDGNGANRFLVINSGVVVVNDLTVSNTAGGTRVNQTLYPGTGGAVINEGHLTLNRIAISACSASPATPTNPLVKGGAIYNAGTLVINTSTLSNNIAKAQNIGSDETGWANSQGGAIYNTVNGMIEINHSSITGNEASAILTTGGTAQISNLCYGGAIYNLGKLTLNHTDLSSNSTIALTDYNEDSPTRARGGGIYNDGTLSILNQSTISNNTVTAETTQTNGIAYALGGGIYSESGASTVITDSTLSANTAEARNSPTGHAWGGGIHSDSAVIRNCRLSGNRAIANTSNRSDAWGGGISCESLTILSSTVSGNSAEASSSNNPESRGGGIYTGSATISNVTVVNNHSASQGDLAASLGGGIYLSSGTTTVRNSTIALNTVDGMTHNEESFAYGAGGGFAVTESGTLQIGNTIVCGNVATGTSFVAGTNVHGAVSSAGFNLLGDTSDTTGLIGSDLSDINASAIFVDSSNNSVIDAADLQQNGGPTKTLALLSSGAATDAGSNALIPIDPDTATAFTTDQRGTIFGRIYAGTVDIGAFEFRVNFPPTALVLDSNSVAENNTVIGTVSSTDPEAKSITYSISQTVGADRALFDIHPTSGVLRFLNAPDYEQPSDQGQDNNYEVQVEASDGSDTTTRLFSINVTNVDWVTSIEDFRAEFALNPDGSDDLGDKSSNGIANILYFLLGLGDPNNPTPPRFGGENLLGLPQQFQDPGNKEVYVYTVRRNPVGYTVIPEVSDDLTAWSNPLGNSPSSPPIKVATFSVDSYYDIYIIYYLSGSNAEYPDATIYPKLFFRVSASKND